MPIKASCSCGAAFSARDDLAGRTVACPKCKQPLTIPAPQAAAPAAPHANADLFDGLGMKARDTNVPRCPGCNADLPPNAVLCVKCGYNLKLGKRMQTISMSGETAGVGGGGGHGGHGGATALLMARAAQAAEEDEIAERTKTKEGMPLWVLVVGLLSCILFAVVMSLIPQATALGGTGAVMVFGAYLMNLYAWVGTMVAAGKKNPLYPLGIFFGDIFVAIAFELLGWLLSCAMETDVRSFTRLFAGIVWLTYAYMNSDECGQFIMFFWLSKAVAFVGTVLIVIAIIIFALEQKEGVGQLTPPPVEAMPTFVLVTSNSGSPLQVGCCQQSAA
jgi:ribosomal protein L40E